MVNAETVKLLREVPEIFSSVPLTEHEKRLEKVLQIRVIDRLGTQGEESLAWLKLAKRAGFHSVVTPDWALRFKYHAGIDGHNVCVDLSVREDHSQSWYWYKGDIPESALDALETFRKIGYDPLQVPKNKDITIHSMEPLPIKIERALPSVDPVMIGWSGQVCFTLGPSGWVASRDYYLGVIIAVWDEFKEMVDYKVDPKNLALQ